MRGLFGVAMESGYNLGGCGYVSRVVDWQVMDQLAYLTSTMAFGNESRCTRQHLASPRQHEGSLLHFLPYFSMIPYEKLLNSHDWTATVTALYPINKCDLLS